MSISMCGTASERLGGVIASNAQLVAAMRDIEFLNALLTGKGSYDDNLVVAMREHRSAYKTGC